MNNSGGLGMGFSPQLVIPEGETEFFRRRLARGRGGGGNKAVTVFAVKEDGTDEDELREEPIMDEWNLDSIGPDGIEFTLNFTNRVETSAGEEPDLLLIQLDLSDYKDVNGQPMPESLVKSIRIPS